MSLRSAFAVFSVCVTSPLATLAWTGPTAAPPGNNVAGPVNIGVEQQFKPGIIGANILNIYGSNQYLNFGNTTGSSGFGIRNNGGLIEYKQNAGNNTAAGWSEVGKGRGSYVAVHLSACGGGPCASYHALQAWVNVSGYSWNTSTNTDTTTFTPNGTGSITINKAGVYRILMRDMMIPALDTVYVGYLCPVINGSVSCIGNITNGVTHGYHPAGSWYQDTAEFVAELAAGTTVGYAYYVNVPMSYWAHDVYTNFSIMRIN